MSKQPNWKFLANLGDANPVEFGGYFIFEDMTGVYSPEGEYLDSENKKAYRFSLDRLTLYNDKLIPFGFDKKSLPHPIEQYTEWFNDDLSGVADYVGMELSELKDSFCSANILERASAYRAIGDYWGFDNLDDYPFELSESESEERYKNWS